MIILAEGKAGPRVEEIPAGPVADIQIVLIVDTGHFQGNSPVLQVEIGREPGKRRIFGSCEQIGLPLYAPAVVPLVLSADRISAVIVVFVAKYLIPEHFTIMVAVVLGKVHAAGYVQLVPLVFHVGIDNIIVVRHGLADDEVALRRSRVFDSVAGEGEIGREAVFGELLVCLVVLIPAVALGPVQRGAPVNPFPELAGVVELEMMLGVIVGVIVIVSDISEFVIVLASLIVLAVLLVIGH